ncbi:MAG: hypothetical protein KatS3mg097_099 [Candidatus Parcubacteria bacterium]|nr:MAG: hypothetical protein KatS3mg097_099 [Candidatus Parcubacteria bacterium]
MDVEIIKNLVVGFIMAIGILGPSLAIGKIGSEALKAVGRNPEAYSKIQTAMILSLAFAEAIAIYVLVVALLVKLGS